MKENIRIAAEMGKIQSELDCGKPIEQIIKYYYYIREKENTIKEYQFYSKIIEILEKYAIYND